MDTAYALGILIQILTTRSCFSKDRIRQTFTQLLSLCREHEDNEDIMDLIPADFIYEEMVTETDIDYRKAWISLWCLMDNGGDKMDAETTKALLPDALAL